MEGQRVTSYNGFARTVGVEIGNGATATIHEIQESPDLVVKLFNEAFRKEHGKTARQKIEALRVVARCGPPEDNSYAAGMASPVSDTTAADWGSIAFPRTTIFTPSGEWLGFSMRKYSGHSLNRLMSPLLLKKFFPNISRFHQIKVLYDIAKCICNLNRSGVYVGDYNADNFIVLPHPVFEDSGWLGSARSADFKNGANNQLVALIDVDGFQARDDGGTLHRCNFVRPDYVAPEIHAAVDSTPILSVESEVFSYAILAFRTFMHGRHPYDQVGGSSPAENIQLGNFPYGIGSAPPGLQGAIPEGPWYTIWSHLPYAIKEAFITTFKDGALEPDKRTPITDWMNLLQVYGRDMKKGWHDSSVTPTTQKSSNYQGNNWHA